MHPLFRDCMCGLFKIPSICIFDYVMWWYDGRHIKKTPSYNALGANVNFHDPRTLHIIIYINTFCFSSFIRFFHEKKKIAAPIHVRRWCKCPVVVVNAQKDSYTKCTRLPAQYTQQQCVWSHWQKNGRKLVKVCEVEIYNNVQKYFRGKVILFSTAGGVRFKCGLSFTRLYNTRNEITFKLFKFDYNKVFFLFASLCVIHKM